MKKRSGRKSSPLDDIRPEVWSAKMSDEFLEMIWVIEETIKIQPTLAVMLNRVVASSCFECSELPKPSAGERGASGDTEVAGDLVDQMEDPDLATG